MEFFWGIKIHEFFDLRFEMGMSWIEWGRRGIYQEINCAQDSLTKALKISVLRYYSPLRMESSPSKLFSRPKNLFYLHITSVFFIFGSLYILMINYHNLLSLRGPTFQSINLKFIIPIPGRVKSQRSLKSFWKVFYNLLIAVLRLEFLSLRMSRVDFIFFKMIFGN